MPTETAAAVTLPLNVASIQASAANELNAAVQEKVVAKYKLIAQRQAVVDSFIAFHNAKVAGLAEAITNATTAAQIDEALNSKEFSFAPRYYQLVTKTTD